ncbi:sodium/glutamate symporter [Maricaulis sp.]|uniref:sodium/glutamate symporter n=1 Tax=Maricaulis sp. TaxID=1486257 RepID=UPI003A8C9B8A
MLGPGLLADITNIPEFETFTLAMIVYFGGVAITRRFSLLREFNIPEPVVGGLGLALVLLVQHLGFGMDISFGTETRDLLLVYFFTSIGINSRFKDLLAGGRPLAMLLGLTLVFMIVQDVVGVAGARLFGLPSGTGVLVGTASLIGGHGTVIAWAPEIARLNSTGGMMELGVANATLGLIVAAFLGGPIARFLISRDHLAPSHEDTREGPVVGLSHDPNLTEEVSQTSMMASLLVLNIAVIIGFIIHGRVQAAGVNLPLFVPCLMVGIVMSNTVPHVFPGWHWPARTRALALLSDYSLSIFLTISLMSLQLWTLSGLGLALILILAVQALAAVVFTVFVLFPLMGRDYNAAVLSAGFAGFVLGATPTAIANMTAVRKRYGPAPLPFIILPIVAAFFVDLANVGLIHVFSQF